MQVAVIVTTCNRPDALRAVLEAIARRTRANSTCSWLTTDRPTRRALVAEFAARSPFRLTHVWQEDQALRAGAARNRALAQTQAESSSSATETACRRLFREPARRSCRARTFSSGYRILLAERFTKEILEKGLPIHAWSTARWLAAWLKRQSRVAARRARRRVAQKSAASLGRRQDLQFFSVARRSAARQRIRRALFGLGARTRSWSGCCTPECVTKRALRRALVSPVASRARPRSARREPAPARRDHRVGPRGSARRARSLRMSAAGALAPPLTFAHPPQRVLVVVTRRIGDVLLATPVVRSLKSVAPCADRHARFRRHGRIHQRESRRGPCPENPRATGLRGASEAARENRAPLLVRFRSCPATDLQPATAGAAWACWKRH